jgi:hypothetical protein
MEMFRGGQKADQLLRPLRFVERAASVSTQGHKYTVYLTQKIKHFLKSVVKVKVSATKVRSESTHRGGSDLLFGVGRTGQL